MMSDVHKTKYLSEKKRVIFIVPDDVVTDTHQMTINKSISFLNVSKRFHKLIVMPLFWQ